MEFNVKIGGNNKIYGLKRDTFSEGELIEFHVFLISDESTSVSSNDVKISSPTISGSTAIYSFVMPDHDVVIDVIRKPRMTCMTSPMGFPFTFASISKTSDNASNSYNQSLSEDKTKTCPECGTSSTLTAKFCTNCGRKLDQV